MRRAARDRLPCPTMIHDLLIAQKPRPQGFEFHYAEASTPERALCGEAVSPTQIPPAFYGVDSAIEGRWCLRCETLQRRAAALAFKVPEADGDAPCV
ncbi:MAG: hypothetical protein ACK53Z_03415 [Betaproteobacteria bacterium]|jgi:hypothetical protein